MNSTIPHGWTVKPLASIASVNWGDTSLTKASYVARGYPAYSASGFDGYLPDFQFDQDGIVLSAIGARCGRVFYATGKWTAIKNTITLFEKPGKSSTRFLYQYFGKPDAWDISGGAQPFIGLTNARKLDVLTPPLPEQQKIAAILSSVDDVIEKTRAQIDKLKDLKTGMMQELLTKGIGSGGVPHTEFKDSPVGRIPVDWEIKPLPEVAENHDSKRVPIKSVDRASIQGGYRYYGASGIIDYVNDYIFDGTFILLGEDGENVLSRHLPLAFIVTGKFWVNNHAHVLKAKDGIDTNYLCEYLEFIDYKNIASGSAQPKITQNSLNAIQVPVPSLEEQQTISRALTSVDNRIRSTSRKLEQLALTKKALMQDLLTGKVRVKVDQKESAVA